MKFYSYFLIFLAFMIVRPVFANPDVQYYLEIATQQQLDRDITWQRLMYADKNNKSEVTYTGFFLSSNGRLNLKEELNANIQGLFQSAEANQSVRCRFPARSQWLMQKLKISSAQLPFVECPEYERWIGQIKPYKATLIFATDFMGNPSSMFGHTLLRLDPKDQKQLNLVSYAINYAATVTGNDNWSYAWKGLTGQYPGEYSLMPYYRKVKEYGDFESRDLWEYELNLNEQETYFLVQHIWEMQHVSFPYYFVSDNCAYRLLGLMDLVRPELSLKDQFKVTTIPVETIKTIEQQGLIKETTYRPALETQLLAQAKQHGQSLAQVAHQMTFVEAPSMSAYIQDYDVTDQAKILEMGYDDLYLRFLSREVDEAFAQPRLRQLLILRSQLGVDKQRIQPTIPRSDPTAGHHSRRVEVAAGKTKQDSFIELRHRYAYHDLLDPIAGYRMGTQLGFLDLALRYEQDNLKLQHLDVLTVNSYNPITAFKAPISWGIGVGWKRDILLNDEQQSWDQHGLLNLNAQVGYSVNSASQHHLCFTQLQNIVQAGQVLDQGWRVGIGPRIGCQSIWTDQIQSVIEVQVPYWLNQTAWQWNVQTEVQYTLSTQHALRLSYLYQQQHTKEWIEFKLGYTWFY